MTIDFSALEEKYGAPAASPPQPCPKPEQYQASHPAAPTSWKDSPFVVNLSNFIKAQPPGGPYLVQTADGCPLLAIPNSDIPDEVIQDAIYLTEHARADLTHLLAAGIIALPTWPILFEADFYPANRRTYP